MSRLGLLILTLGLVIPGHSAMAQFGSSTKVDVSAIAQRTEAAPGEQFAIAVVLDHAKGWHTQTNDPKVPDELKDLDPVPTQIQVEAPRGLKVGPIQWPNSETLTVLWIGKPLSLEFFAGKAIAFVPVQLASGVPMGNLTIPLKISIQACDESQCLMPEDVTRDVTITVKPLTDVASRDVVNPQVFDAFDPSVFSRMNAGAVASVQPATSGFDFVGYKFSLRRDQTLLILLIALAAGFLLNLTPCVLPVIPIKILSLQQQAGNPGKLALFGSVYCVGIVATFLVLGLLIFGIVTGGQKQDWGQVFTSRWFTIVMAAIVGLMGLGMIGLFTVRLPQSVYMLNPSHDTVLGNFLLGVLTAVLSTPCTGPLLGATIAWAATQPAWMGLVTFVVMGIGMALPYALLIAFPRLIDILPKAGPGGELLKQVLGILMLAVAAFLLSNLTSEKWPWFVVGGVAAVGGLWAIIGGWRMLRTIGAKTAVTVCALVWIGATVWTTRALASEGPITWTRFVNVPETDIRKQIARALDSGKTVVVDFTAKWCTNCHVIERNVLLSEVGVGLLSSADVVPMKIDLTSADEAQGWGLVREISGGGGIPLVAIFRPGMERPIFFNSFFKPSDLESAVRGPVPPV
ncbi:MAG: thioredoxin family protein [Phycisphaeraceae bacterium]|nr:thioredoxin family protein [Phycisphaeraceae bacterium]